MPRDQQMLKGHLPRVTYHQVYWYTKVPGLCAQIDRDRDRDMPVQWFRGGLVLKTRRLLYNSTLGLKLKKKRHTSLPAGVRHRRVERSVPALGFRV